MKATKKIIGGLLAATGMLLCVCETANGTPAFGAMLIGIVCIAIAAELIGKDEEE